MRNLETFSEFQLGIVQAIANASQTQIRINFINSIPRMVSLEDKDDGEILLQWMYGQEPMIFNGSDLVPVRDYNMTIGELAREFQMYGRPLNDILDEWFSDLEDDNNG